MRRTAPPSSRRTDSDWRRQQTIRRPEHATFRRVPFLLIAVIYIVFSAGIGTMAALALHERSHPPNLAALPGHAAPKYLVLMVLDGARPDYLTVTSLPHLDALRTSGAEFTNAFDGILEAETPTGHTTIATGSRPDRDGILGFDWGQSDATRYSLFNPDQMGTVEQIIESTHVPTIGSLYKAKYPRARVVALSGHKYYAAAPLGGPDADAIMYYEGDPHGRYVPVAVPGHMPPAGVLSAPGLIYPTTHLKPGVEDNLVTKLALASVRKMHPRILLMNYPEFDWPLGHVDGGILDKPMVSTDMKGYDRDLGMIEDAYRKAGILDQTLFVVTADHGMMPISRFVPSSVISNAVSQAGTTAPDIASNSGDFVWLADPTKAQAVAQNIVSAHDPGIASVYYLTSGQSGNRYVAASDQRIPGSAETANQYLLESLINGHEPAVVVFGREGTSFSDPASKWKADHGGNTWQSQHIPLVMAGPGVRPGIVTAPAQLDDVAPTALADMGVKPTGMEGHVLTEALLTSGAKAREVRRAELRQIVPVARGLLAGDVTTATK